MAEDFTVGLEQQYPGLRWAELEKKMERAIYELFSIVAAKDPPQGIELGREEKAEGERETWDAARGF